MNRIERIRKLQESRKATLPKNGLDGKDGYTPQKGIDYFDGQDGKDGKPGEKGDKGAIGLTGPRGAKGLTGKPGEKGEKGDKGLNYRSDWKKNTKYNKDDTVVNDGSSFFCIKSHTSTAEDQPLKGGNWKVYWGLLARKGDKGEKGERGPQGYVSYGGGGSTAAETPDASSTVKGKLKLTNDLGGTADAPTTPTAVHLTGDETVAGVKNFSDGIEVDSITSSDNTASFSLGFGSAFMFAGASYVQLDGVNNFLSVLAMYAAVGGFSLGLLELPLTGDYTLADNGAECQRILVEPDAGGHSILMSTQLSAFGEVIFENVGAHSFDVDADPVSGGTVEGGPISVAAGTEKKFYYYNGTSQWRETAY